MPNSSEFWWLVYWW